MVKRLKITVLSHGLSWWQTGILYRNETGWGYIVYNIGWRVTFCFLELWLILEQHMFELHESTYRWIFFPPITTTALCHQSLIE